MIPESHERETGLLRWAATKLLGAPTRHKKKCEDRFLCPSCDRVGLAVLPPKQGEGGRWRCRLPGCDARGDLQHLLELVNYVEPDGSPGRGAGLLYRWRCAHKAAGYPCCDHSNVTNVTSGARNNTPGTSGAGADKHPHGCKYCSCSDCQKRLDNIHHLPDPPPGHWSVNIFGDRCDGKEDPWTSWLGNQATGAVADFLERLPKIPPDAPDYGLRVARLALWVCDYWVMDAVNLMRAVDWEMSERKEAREEEGAA